MAKCEKCEGKGWVFVANGPDDVDKDECQWCEGTGGLICSRCGEMNDSEDNVLYCQSCEEDIKNDEWIDLQIESAKEDKI